MILGLEKGYWIEMELLKKHAFFAMEVDRSHDKNEM